MNPLYETIKKPIISEKANALTELGNRYTFVVDTMANKLQIRNAVEQLFNVKVVSVRTSLVHGKVKRVGRFVTKRSNWKKAIVTLKDGQKIDYYDSK